MEYQFFGKTTDKISRIGFGCMSLKAGQSTAASIIDAALDGGINYFDTADLYEQGANEEMIGTLLAPHRNRVFIATKVGNQWRKDGSGWDWNPRKDYILQAVDASLKRLKTDTIDLYQLHGGTIADPIDETIEAFETLKAAGKIRYYGISSIRPNVIREYVSKSNISSVMMQYSLLDRRPEEECLPLLENHSITVLARGTLASGLLLDKTPKDYLGHSIADIREIRTKLGEIAKQYQVHPATVAIRFALHNAAVGAAVVGIRTMEQLAEAIQAIQEQVPEETLIQLSKYTNAGFYSDHR
ncbi:aldo/keto reductase [Flavihumibacter sp. UBA7668]|uniref:aldo/keto reductase n=1 Tax=Flavihumibacter sp. UBA7668 TaxID=1946542 RepID=UPI0025C24D11|nr:aldo/keto reductase [Flavihumibacter sp. UBA7668]